MLKKNQENQQKYYNKKAVKELPELQDGIKVGIQLKHKSKWIPGIVVRKIRDRTYIVKTKNGHEYVRNRKFIKIIKDRKNKEIEKTIVCLNSERGRGIRVQKMLYRPRK